MQPGVKIAISGKGGVGKTTVCAVWAQLFAEDGLDVLAIDADSDPNLASAGLGVAVEETPEPLIEMKQLIGERTGAKPGAVGQYFKLNPKVSDLPEKYWHKINGIRLLVLATKNAGAGCACPESAFLKALLTHVILQRSEAILVDLAAGLEFMGRACVQGVNGLVIVVEPGARSIETAVNIARMGREMGVEHVAAFANKITDPAQMDIIRSQLGPIPMLGSFRLEPALAEADLKRLPVAGASSELCQELRKAKETMVDLFFKDRVLGN